MFCISWFLTGGNEEDIPEWEKELQQELQVCYKNLILCSFPRVSIGCTAIMELVFLMFLNLGFFEINLLVEYTV